ncbi:MAG: GTPase HflX [Gemmatimonadaceae bacterium]|nr:GTPase HflX [Gemmatimonadaceae bacterium]
MLVGAPIKSARARHLLNEHLEELAELADTAGATVVGEVTQMLDRPHPGTYLGKGKIEELRLAIEVQQATVIIFDDELSPAQGRNVETALNTRVVDRAELILDIFATRARTSEAKMQVELAQLEYTLPRLTRMWTHLEKFRGGIGMRGPGETQLETDRRLINNRIKLLKERLVDVTRARVVQRHSRKGEFRVSLVGYTNAGKSSVLRSLAGDSQVFVEDRLFATLDPLTREVKLGEHQKALVTDTVGFIRKLPHHLVASFRATLEEVNESDLLLHVIDASRSTWEDHVHVVDGVLNELGVLEKPVLHVFNKIDRLDNDALLSLQEQVRDKYPDSIFVSAVSEHGLEPLLRALTTRVRTMRPVSEVRIPVSDGRLLAELHREGEVIDQRSEDSELVLHVRATEALIGRLKRGGATVS